MLRILLLSLWLVASVISIFVTFFTFFLPDIIPWLTKFKSFFICLVLALFLSIYNPLIVTLPDSLHLHWIQQWTFLMPFATMAIILFKRYEDNEEHLIPDLGEEY